MAAPTTVAPSNVAVSYGTPRPGTRSLTGEQLLQERPDQYGADTYRGVGRRTRRNSETASTSSPEERVQYLATLGEEASQKAERRRLKKKRLLLAAAAAEQADEEEAAAAAEAEEDGDELPESVSVKTAAKTMHRRHAFARTTRIAVWVGWIWLWFQLPLATLYTITVGADSTLIGEISSWTEFIGVTSPVAAAATLFMGLTAIVGVTQLALALGLHYLHPLRPLHSLGGSHGPIKILLFTLVFASFFFPLLSMLPFIMFWLFYVAYYPE